MAHDLRVTETLERARQIKRKPLIHRFAGIAFRRVARIDLVDDAVMDAGKDCGKDQIGIGVGAGDTMFDAAFS